MNDKEYFNHSVGSEHQNGFDTQNVSGTSPNPFHTVIVSAVMIAIALTIVGCVIVAFTNLFPY